VVKSTALKHQKKRFTASADQNCALTYRDIDAVPENQEIPRIPQSKLGVLTSAAEHPLLLTMRSLGTTLSRGGCNVILTRFLMLK
jgi:hypothetical protein